MAKRKIIFTFLLCLILMGPSIASAETSIGFTYVFDEGPLAGQVGKGSFKVDGPPDGTYFADTGLLTFLVIEGGETFSVSDDEGFPHLPGVRIESDPFKVRQLDYWADLNDDSSDDGPTLTVFIHPNGAEPVNLVRYRDEQGLDSIGHTTLFYIITDIVGADDLTYKLPEPPEKSATNRELTARANKYGVTVSELFTSENRSRTLRNRK